MAKLFGNFKTDGVQEHVETVGTFQSYESDIYRAKIKNAWHGSASSGAQFIDWTFELPGNRTFSERLFFTNKKGEVFYERNEEKRFLPGYNQVNALCLVTTGVEFAEQETEEKYVKIYNPETQKEENVVVPVLIDLLGQEVDLGILKVKEFKQEKGDDGSYHDTDKIITKNTIDMIFHAESGLTVTEAKRGEEKPELREKWLKANQGNERDRTQRKSSGSSATPPKQGASGNGNSPRKSLFGK